MRMKGARNLLMVGLVAAGLVLSVAQTRDAGAITLGYPDIAFDSHGGPGANTFTGSSGAGVFYSFATGLLSVSAQAPTIDFGGGATPLTSGTVDYQVKLVSSSVTPPVVTGNFGTDGVAGPDLIVDDSGAGVLLTGDFVSYTINSMIGGNVGGGEAIFTVTGGTLAPLFLGLPGGMVHLEFNISPLFSALTYTADFSGEVKGDLAPVPEPATLLLLGSGLVGMGWFGRKRMKDNDKDGEA